MTAVETMLGATELHLAPFLSGGILLDCFLILVVETRLTRVCNGGSGTGAVVVHFKGLSFR